VPMCFCFWILLSIATWSWGKWILLLARIHFFGSQFKELLELADPRFSSGWHGHRYIRSVVQYCTTAHSFTSSGLWTSILHVFVYFWSKVWIVKLMYVCIQCLAHQNESGKLCYGIKVHT
jgi:hypothetical protein